MNKLSLKRHFLMLCIINLTLTGVIFGQTNDEKIKRVNFRYSENPKTKARTENIVSTQDSNAGNNASTGEVKSVDNSEQRIETENTTVAKKTLEIAKRANAAIVPTEIYKVGIGDVLFISLQNAPSKASTYFTVLNDGMIDYPLAGEMVSVLGLTTEDIEDLLKEKIKLYENPQVSVKVREHSSHKITVFGLVENAGNKYLQREAMPLYAIRAEAIVQQNADLVIIKRANSETEEVDLKEPKSGDILIFPGDIIEFKSNETKIAQTPQYYYIGGFITSAGQKEFHQGITLTQAILACGGLTKQNAKNVVIRRKNEVGLLSAMGFDLKAIKVGKQPDPVIFAGDTIEIEN